MAGERSGVQDERSDGAITVALEIKCFIVLRHQQFFTENVRMKYLVTLDGKRFLIDADSDSEALRLARVGYGDVSFQESRLANSDDIASFEQVIQQTAEPEADAGNPASTIVPGPGVIPGAV